MNHVPVDEGAFAALNLNVTGPTSPASESGMFSMFMAAPAASFPPAKSEVNPSTL